MKHSVVQAALLKMVILLLVEVRGGEPLTVVVMDTLDTGKLLCDFAVARAIGLGDRGASRRTSAVTSVAKHDDSRSHIDEEYFVVRSRLVQTRDLRPESTVYQYADAPLVVRLRCSNRIGIAICCSHISNRRCPHST